MDLYPEVQSRLFNAAIQISRFDIAYSVLVLFKDRALQHSSLRTLIFRMCESQSVAQLLDFPFLGLRTEVDEILEDKCHTIVDVNAGVPYHKILYSWHMKQGDFRAAAGVCLERLKRLQQAGEGDKVTGHRQGVDEFETPVTQQYLMLISALSCVDPKQRWFLVEPLPLPTGKGPAVPEKRKVVTLEQMRKAYQDELDRIAAIGNNQFALVGGDEMEL
jgi:nuclear pore complex protein Nup160